MAAVDGVGVLAELHLFRSLKRLELSGAVVAVLFGVGIPAWTSLGRQGEKTENEGEAQGKLQYLARMAWACPSGLTLARWTAGRASYSGDST